MPVVIDNESGEIVGEFDATRKRAKKTKVAKKVKPRAVAPDAMADLAETLGAVQAIFDTADHVARILKGR